MGSVHRPTFRSAHASANREFGIVAGSTRESRGLLTFQARATYEIPCNWKVYVDNYLDGIPRPYMHPDLSGNLELVASHHAWNCVVDASMQWQNR